MMVSRRSFSKLLVGAYVAAQTGLSRTVFAGSGLIQKAIPSSGEQVPVVGLGSWITFNIGRDPRGQESVQRVIEAFFDAGGRLVDSSPMYGSSQAVIGRALARVSWKKRIFSADKVWTNGQMEGRSQITESLKRWQIPNFSLLQVHNLRDWQAHLETLFAMKESGHLNYVGVTTSHGRRHRELMSILKSQPLDFLQVTYNMLDRDVEQHILPLARERGVAVIANRPFDGGRLIRRLKEEAFPEWALAEGFSGWADFLLKFNASHEAITCSIPATTRVDHVRENMAGSVGHLPERALRARMLQYVGNL